MVAQWSAETRADALALARELRAGGPARRRLSRRRQAGKQFKYASERNVPFVVVLGDDERQPGRSR